MIKEYLSLLTNMMDLEKNQTVQKLLADFKQVLPKRFGEARFIIAPSNTTLSHVIRADCANKNCRVRACVHVSRNVQGSLEIEEKDQDGTIKILYDRTDICCSNCRQLIM